MKKRVLPGIALAGLVLGLAPPLHEVAGALECPAGQPPGRAPGQTQSGDNGRPEGYGPGECQLALSTSTGSAGSSFTASGTGFGPGSSVTLTFESDPVVLAVVTANSSGSFTAGLTVPADAEPGTHTVRASGVDADGNPHQQNASFTVVGEPSASEDGTQSSGTTSGATSDDTSASSDAEDDEGGSGSDEVAVASGGEGDGGSDALAVSAPEPTADGGSSMMGRVALAAVVAATLLGIWFTRRRRVANT